MRRLKLSKGRVHITKPERKQNRADMESQSSQSITKLSQKYGVAKDWQ